MAIDTDEEGLSGKFSVELSKIVERMYFDIRAGVSDLRPYERQIKGLAKKELKKRTNKPQEPTRTAGDEKTNEQHTYISYSPFVDNFQMTDKCIWHGENKPYTHYKTTKEIIFVTGSDGEIMLIDVKQLHKDAIEFKPATNKGETE